MVLIDEFESQFRRSSKTPFTAEEVPLNSAAIVLTEERRKELDGFLRGFFMKKADSSFKLIDVPASGDNNNQQLLSQIKEIGPDIVVTEHILDDTRQATPYALGSHVHDFSQELSVPLLLLPDLESSHLEEHYQRTTSGLVLTDDIKEESHLINCCLPFVEENGTLILADVEDRYTHERYLSIISKIPSLSTDIAKVEIEAQMRREALEYMESCKKALHTIRPDVSVEELFEFLDSMKALTSLILSKAPDILLLSGKDHSQTAMAPLAYALCIELPTMLTVLV